MLLLNLKAHLHLLITKEHRVKSIKDLVFVFFMASVEWNQYSLSLGKKNSAADFEKGRTHILKKIHHVGSGLKLFSRLVLQITSTYSSVLDKTFALFHLAINFHFVRGVSLAVYIDVLWLLTIPLVQGPYTAHMFRDLTK